MTQQHVTMAMADYLAEVQHAVEGLLPLIWQEWDALAGLEARVAHLEKVVPGEYAGAASAAVAAEDAEDAGLATLRYWEARDHDEERHDIAAQLPAVQAAIQAHRFSVEALAGAFIQIAKQGMALVHGGKPSARGRTVGRSQQLSEVIWQARNRSLHWEDGSFSSPVVTCFTALASEVDQVFSDYRTRNMAFDVIEMLGWRTIGAFDTDLLTVG
jgi:hypothetical protein